MQKTRLHPIRDNRLLSLLCPAILSACHHHAGEIARGPTLADCLLSDNTQLLTLAPADIAGHESDTIGTAAFFGNRGQAPFFVFRPIDADPTSVESLTLDPSGKTQVTRPTPEFEGRYLVTVVYLKCRPVDATGKEIAVYETEANLVFSKVPPDRPPPTGESPR